MQDQKYTYEWKKSLKQNLIWIICRFLECSNQLFNGWTEFNMIRDALQLESVIIVFDQAIYVKATDSLEKSCSLWKHHSSFSYHRNAASNNWHFIFGIQSIVVEEGSVGSLLNGKHYNRGVRFHKLVYKVCTRLVWEGFITWISENNEQKSILEGL